MRMVYRPCRMRACMHAMSMTEARPAQARHKAAHLITTMSQRIMCTDSSQDWSKVGPKLDTGRRKRTPAQRAELLFDKLLDALRREWQSVRSLNLGRYIIKIFMV